MLSEEQKKANAEAMDHIQEYACKLLDVSGAVIKGESVSQACLKAGIDYAVFRRLFLKDGIRRNEEVLINAEPINPQLQFNDWRQDLLYDIFNRRDMYVIDDFDSVFEYVGKNALTEREFDILKRHYVELETLEEIGAAHGVTRDRIRQILAKAIRKLRAPRFSRYFRFGMVVDYRDQVDKAIDDYVRAISASKKNLKRLKDAVHKGLLSDDETELIFDAFPSLTENPKIEDLELSVRPYNCLYRAGIKTVSDLVDLAPADFFKIRNLGKKSVKEIIEHLRKFAPEHSNWCDAVEKELN